MLTSMRKFFTGKGQGIVEYAVLLAFVVAIAAYAFSSDSGIKGEVKSTFSDTAATLQTVRSNQTSQAGGGGN